MPSLSRILAYVLAGIPAAIGVAFVARFAYVTSDTAIDGASNAFLFGMIAAGAFVGPPVAIIVAGNGHKRAARALWALAFLAIVANWSHTLGAIANRGAGTEAERAKASDAVKDDRAELARIVAERAGMVFTPTTAEAATAAREAITAAEAIRLRECGNGDLKQRGPNCRLRETEEQAKRDALAVVLTGKASTDKAEKLDSDAAVIRARLAKAPAVQSGNAIGEALGKFLPMSALTAATFQQGFVSAIVELLIAAALALPELLRSDRSAAAKRDTDDAIAAEVSARPVVVTDVQLIEPPRPDVETVGRFMLACLSRSKGAEAAGGEVYARYLQWCGEQAVPLAALAPNAFAEQFAARCLRAGIRTRRGDGKVYCIGVKVAA